MLLAIKIANGIIMNFTIIFIVKQLLGSKVKMFSSKVVFWLLISILPYVFSYTEDYNLIITFLLFLSLSLSLNKIFEIDITSSIVFALYTMLFCIFPDLICCALVISMMSFEAMRDNILILFLTNMLIAIGIYLIFQISYVKKFTLNSIAQLQKPKRRKTIVYSLFAFIAICIVYLILYVFQTASSDYIIVNILVLIFIFLMFAYMSEIIRYDKLKVKNDVLYECMENIENYQEKQDLKIHEYKNQLSKVASMTKDKEVLKKLEEILEIDLNPDNYILGQLKYIPKGEIKSLIYYKLLVASKKNLNILIDVSPKLTKKNFKLTEKENMELSQLIGIYFDNAIEAASKSKKKNISLEVYLIKGELTITIMNTFKGTVDLDNIEKKEFSTKGVGRGKGLYFAKKIVSNSASFETKNELTKDGKYYIQKITVKKS